MRYFFDEVGNRRISDIRGRDFQREDEAVAHAQRLAADVRALETVSERGNMIICVLGEHGNAIHRELVFGA